MRRFATTVQGLAFFSLFACMTSPKKPNPSATTPNKPDSGLRKGLTSYGDNGFSLFLRKAFIKGAGYTDKALDRPVVGIANTGSAYNPCHGNAPN